MKIALVLQPWDTAVPVVGGDTSIPILNHKLAKRLAEYHKVVIYSKDNGLRPETEYDEEGIKYRRIKCFVRDRLRKIVNMLRRTSLGFTNPRRPFFASHIYYPEYGIKVARDIRKEECDVVHIHNFTQYIPVIRAFNPKCRFVIHMHCEWLSQLDRAMMWRRVKKVDLILSCSEHVTDRIRQRFPVLADKCHTLFNGVDLEQFNSTSRLERETHPTKKSLLFVGRISPEKGLHVLIKAFEEVVKRFPDAHLNLIGPKVNAPFDFIVPISDDKITSDLAKYYTKKAAVEVVRFEDEYYQILQRVIPDSLTGKIIFHGSISHDELLPYYRTADIFILPSVWEEPYGIPVVEAMMARVPIVSTKSGGIKEVVQDGKTGFLVERDDSEEMGKAIISLLENNELSQSLVEAAHERAITKFSSEPVVQELIRYYNQYLPEKAKR
ncbi:MAG: glycosyltransferase family 4 protein [Verrucomicrobia bacterium]|nr:glycosyltransferase family 4 protein [Verrucomicrobiota bacterium]